MSRKLICIIERARIVSSDKLQEMYNVAFTSHTCTLTQDVKKASFLVKIKYFFILELHTYVRGMEFFNTKMRECAIGKSWQEVEFNVVTNTIKYLFEFGF